MSRATTLSGNNIGRSTGERVETTARRPAGSNGRPQSATNAAKSAGPTQEQIRRRAYEIYLRRNGGPGDASVDWLQAECELRGACECANRG